MSETVTLSTKGQVVVPKAVRDRLGWRAGSRLEVEIRGDEVVLRVGSELPVTRVEDLYGCLRYDGPPVSVEEMSATIERERLRRARTKSRR